MTAARFLVVVVLSLTGMVIHCNAQQIKVRGTSTVSNADDSSPPPRGHCLVTRRVDQDGEEYFDITLGAGVDVDDFDEIDTNLLESLMGCHSTLLLEECVTSLHEVGRRLGDDDEMEEYKKLVKDSSDKLTKAVKALDVQDASKPWSERLKKVGGVDSNDYIKSVADSVTKTAGLIKDCVSKKGCSEAAVKDYLSQTLLGVATTISAAYPPAAVVFAILGSLGSILFAFDSAPAGIPALNKATVKEAVQDALRDFKAEIDETEVNVIKESTSEFIKDNTDTLDQILQIENNPNKTKAAKQSEIDAEVNLWFSQVYQFRWGKLLSDVDKLKSKFAQQFSTSTGSRSVVLDWFGNCDDPKVKASCRLEYGAENKALLFYGKSRIPVCKSAVTKAGDSWTNMLKFGKTWLSVVLELTQFMASTNSVFQKFHGCSFDNTSTPKLENCYFAKSMKSIYTTVGKLTGSVQFMADAMTKLPKLCSSHAAWPLNQTCKSDKDCNYGNLIILPRSDYIDNLGGNTDGALLDILGQLPPESLFLKKCRQLYENVQGAFPNGCWGFYERKDSPYASDLSLGNCKNAYTFGSGFNTRLVAMANFCPSVDCVKAVRNDEYFSLTTYNN